MINIKNRFVFTMAIMLSFISSCICLSFAEATLPVGMVFEKKNEPREHAFTIKVPKGWFMEGGIFRLLAHKIGGPLNTTESKCDLTLKSDSQGSIYFRILPDIIYAHPGIGGGFFPVGTGYQGAEIKPFVDAPTFVTQFFTYLHPPLCQGRCRLLNALGIFTSLQVPAEYLKDYPPTPEVLRSCHDQYSSCVRPSQSPFTVFLE